MPFAGIGGCGGADAAGKLALATPGDPEAVPAAGVGGVAAGGGGIVPWPNSAGDAVGEDGSATGDDAAR